MAAGRRRSSRRASWRADDWVVIPTGVAHGFLALEPLELIYLVTNEYDGTDELGFAWDDPAVAVDWPPLAGTADGRPILSARDGANPSWPSCGAISPRRRLTRTPEDRTGTHRARPKGLAVSGPSRD